MAPHTDALEDGSSNKSSIEARRLAESVLSRPWRAVSGTFEPFAG
jgi:hypothetical protein